MGISKLKKWHDALFAKDITNICPLISMIVQIEDKLSIKKIDPNPVRKAIESGV